MKQTPNRSFYIRNKHLGYPDTSLWTLVPAPNIFGNNYAIFDSKHIRCIQGLKRQLRLMRCINNFLLRHFSGFSMRNIMTRTRCFICINISTMIAHPVSEGKPNANHVRARMRTHVHSDYINDTP
jgi:hypothetical protein